MLKTLTPEEPELIRLCRANIWVAVVHRCESHPEEANPTPLAEEGAGTTALAIAVRSGAPIGAIQALVHANAHQLSVFHKFSGTILHEALKHRTPFDVLRYLLQAVIHHERVHCEHENYVSMFARQDQLQRTVLHHMVVRAIRESASGGVSSGMWILFRSIVLAYPHAIQAMDADGNTPLVLALVNPDIQNERDEAYVFRMVQLMATTWPSAATIARRGKHHHWKYQEHGHQDVDSPPTIGDGAPNPLSYAILYGRTEKTFELLLEANRTVGINACLTVVSGYREVPLHLAISLRSPITLVKDLVEYEPTATRIQDMYHLTPLDWMWIRHVVDWCSVTEPFSADVMPSTRRYLSPHFAGWHDRVSEAMKSGKTNSKRKHLESLLERMYLLLPAAAQAATKEPVCEQGEPWSLLHSACFVSCPLAVVRLAHEKEPDVVTIRDLRSGRLPLHYAAARTGYRATVPVGVSREVRTMVESSPAMELASTFVQATHVVDANGQLPLHIAIDTAKISNDKEATVVTELLHLYPDSLERRDGKTKLYPSLQAAAGQDASLNMTFMLLHKHPALMSNAFH